MNWLKKYLSEILLGIVIILIGGLYAIEFYFYFYQSNQEEILFEEEIKNEEVSVAPVKKMFVDIKGAVKTPGVYEITDETLINDVIILAGGFNSNAYTHNINLSKKLANETVIYVYTKYEYSLLNTPKEKEECICPEVDISSCINSGSSIIETEDNNKDVSNENDASLENDEIAKVLININSATKEQLLTLNGIGDAKAQSIIEYRTTNGNFQTIEDIKKVSGISDSIYEKIKDDITV